MPTTLTLIVTDITHLRVDAIVNSAHHSLLGGSGVDGAIHRAAGAQLLAECRTLGGCATGAAKITRGYHLPAKYVIHAVAPVWQGGTADEARLLASCYRNSLSLALHYGCKDIAFSAMGCGVYAYPPLPAAQIAAQTCRDFCAEHRGLERVYFVAFTTEVEWAYQQVLGHDD